jgi:ADP-ribosylglycohydrolase
VHQLDRIRGCLLGGAAGDALGAPVEFMTGLDIAARFGPDGVTALPEGTGRITDDTQMTLFTAEGLIRAHNRLADQGTCDVPAVILRAYQRWLFTQEGSRRAVPWDPEFPAGPSGWLVEQPFLHDRRAPGTTCLSSLRAAGAGTVEHRRNNSKGCGGIMRTAPVGLVSADPFDLACEIAALTHGHPSGFLAAGAFAVIVARLMAGDPLHRSVMEARRQVADRPEAEEVTAALDGAVNEAAAGPGNADSVVRLGQGWVAEEALAIAVYCALVAPTFRAGVLLAVNHGGDSDSTGAMTGNLLGTALGAPAIDDDLLNGLEGRDVIEQVAADLGVVLDGGMLRPCHPGRYPPW